MKIMVLSKWSNLWRDMFNSMYKGINNSDIYQIDDLAVKIVPIEECYSYLYMPNINIFKKINKLEPDIIVTDYIHIPGLISKIHGLFRGTKLITMLRGNFWAECEDILNQDRYNKMVVPKVPKSLYKYDIPIPKWVYKYAIYAVGDMSVKMSDKILTISQWLKGDIEKRVSSIPIEVLYQGVNTSIFYRYNNSEIESIIGQANIEKPSILIMQNFSIFKKARFLRNFSYVIRKLNKFNFYFAGPDGGYLSYVKDYYNGIKNVHFIGELKYPYEVASAMNSCDLYVHPTGLDCFPLTILEAGACEKCTIASNIGGIPEEIDDRKTGILIGNEDQQKWIDTITYFIENKKEATKIGRQARFLIENKFSWNIIGKKFIDIVENM